MRQNTAPYAGGQPADPRPLRINYRGLDGVGYVVIPPELVGHPALSPFIPPDTIVRLQALIDVVDYYKGKRQ